MLLTGFPLTGALGLMMPYLPAPVMEVLAFALLVSRMLLVAVLGLMETWEHAV
jgi:hypothetical protein